MKRWEVLHEYQMSNSKYPMSNDDVIKVLLSNRGLKTEEEIGDFLRPRFEDLTIEKVGIDRKQLQKTLERIKVAVEKNEQIVVYGDYDVDGITASAIIWEVLHSLGAKVMPYIPHRVDEGYGLSIKGIANVQTAFDAVKLIITVDNGIVANEAVDYANSQGIDVIITDHHVASGALPNSLTIVHTTKLCGAGIAYMVAKEIKKTFSVIANEVKQSHKKEDSFYKIASSPAVSRNDNVEEGDNLLELATLGTIADLVPLKDGNRIIVKYGLPKLSKTKRPGLLALFQEAGCDNGSIGVYEVGHIIAPRLNATGRMTSAMDSLRLLCTPNRQRGEELASLLGVTNKERQTVMTEATKHAIESIKYRVSSSEYEGQNVKKLLIAVHEDYPEGVIGLVAGRMVEEFYRPAIVISKGEKVSKGSVRSISGFNIIEFLRQSSDFFVNIGGHPMAAGFTIATDKIAQMQSELERLAEAMDDGILMRTLRIDCEVPLTMVTDKFHAALQALGPFGMGNPEPVFATRQVTIEDMRVLGREGKHLRLTVSQPGAIMEAIAFGMGERAQELHIGDKVDIAYTVDENTWNGRRKLQLKVKDIQK